MSRRSVVAMMVGLFLVAFFLRAYRPISRPHQWLTRAEEFYEALDKQKWSSTYQMAHPGVTTMAISGLALRLYHASAGTPAEALFNWAIPPYATDYGRRMAVGVMGLSFVISGLIVAITLAVRRLSNWTLALLVAGLFVFDPFYLGQSRSLHVDALVGLLMLLSALLLLISLQEGRRHYLLLSGLVGGFALLTKTPSLFLIPYTALTLLAHFLTDLRAGWNLDRPEGRARWLAGEAGRGLLLPGVLWAVMLVLPFALWPAMWVHPIRVLGNMFTKSNQYRLTPHQYRFFAGQFYIGQTPSLLYYPAVLAFDSTFVTLIFGLMALGHYLLWPRRGRLPVKPLLFWLLVAFPFFFTLQMGISAKQSGRYVTPTQVGLSVIAAVGLNGFVNLLQEAFADGKTRLAKSLPAVVAGLVIALHALVALIHMPDYGAHHNYLLGGNRVATRVIDAGGQNEGFMPVAAFLNRQADPESLSVGVIRPVNRTTAQYFTGEVTIGMKAANDYHLFNIGSMQRHISPNKWEAALRAYGDGPAQVVVTYDGVPYMRLYATRPDESFRQIVVRRGGTGFVWMARACTAALLGALLWSLARTARGRSLLSASSGS